MHFLLLLITILYRLLYTSTCLAKFLVFLVLTVHRSQFIQYVKDVKVVISLVLRKPRRQRLLFDQFEGFFDINLGCLGPPLQKMYG